MIILDNNFEKGGYSLELVSLVLREHASEGHRASLVPRPSLTAFFAAVANFATAAKKAVREGLGTRLSQSHLEQGLGTVWFRIRVKL